MGIDLVLGWTEDSRWELFSVRPRYATINRSLHATAPSDQTSKTMKAEGVWWCSSSREEGHERGGDLTSKQVLLHSLLDLLANLVE